MQKPSMERHVQTVLISVITAGIVAIGAFTFNTNADVKVMKEQIATLADTVRELKEALQREQGDNRARIDKLSSEVSDTRVKITENQRDMISLESRILILETKGKR